MKHLFTLTAIVCIALCTACSDFNDSETTTYHVQAKAYLEEGARTTIIDDIEANRAKVLWDANDQIGIISATNNALSIFNLTNGAGKNIATFEGDITTINPTEANYFSFYPAQDQATINNGRLNLILPTQQQNVDSGIDGDACGFMIAKSSNTSIDKLSFTFENLFAVLRLPIIGSGEQLANISFAGGNGEITSGAFEVDLTTPQYDITFSKEGSLRTLLLDNSQLSTEAKVFYLVVPAINYTSGYSIRITTTDGQTMYRSVGSNGGRTLERGVIYKLPTVDFEAQRTDLSLQGTANCYIVSKAGSYCFDSNLPNGAKAELIWQDNEGIISNVELSSDGYVGFDATAIRGNALLAVRDASGTIIGSWHIWATDTPQAQTYSDGTKALDRNLGAMSSTDAGLFYQWGRPTPFFAAPQTAKAENLSDAISKPEYFFTNWADMQVPNDSWGNATTTIYSSAQGSKSVNDPCPAGWRVASPIFFSNIVKSLKNTADSYYTIQLDNGIAYYPLKDRLDHSGKLGSSKCGYMWTNSNYVTATSATTYGAYFQYSAKNTTSFAGDGSKIYLNKTYGLNVRCVAE